MARRSSGPAGAQAFGVSGLHIEPRCCKQLGFQERNRAVGIARALVVGRQIQRLAVLAQTKVATRIVCRIGHQPQMGQFIALRKRLGILRRKAEIRRIDIACGQPENPAQLRQGAADAASGFKGFLGFRRIGKP
jgi:hypothetical protein